MSTEVATDHSIVLDPQAIEAINEAFVMIHAAYNYSDGIDIPWEKVESGEAIEMVENRRQLAREMERSFYRSLTNLIVGPQSHDGALKVWRDGPGSLYWKHEKSGYHGGLIFHRNHNPPANTLGSWSIHT